jgi:cell division transport system permease protein
MFILPLMAILLGIEFYLVFDRTTGTYEEGLKEDYSMLVVSKKPVTLEDLKRLNPHISSLRQIKREQIVAKVAKGLDKAGSREILKSLPYFYDVGLDAYLDTNSLSRIKKDLEKDKRIKKVETFGSSYGSSYRLFKFVKFIIAIFIGFIGVVSLLLIIKQMEIWKYEHRQRMQVMEIFGAPLMLRSGVLFKVAILDAIVASLLTAGVFFYVKLIWAPQSGIDIIINNQEKLFRMTDMGILLGAALLIVTIAVYSVVFSARGVEE